VTEDTKNMYTSNQGSDTVSGPEVQAADVVWMGDSHDRIRSFPKGPRSNLGAGLRDVQLGKQPPDSSPVPGVGRTGVFELRDEDESSWYRAIYLKKIRNRIYVLHCFEKTTNRIEKQDIRTIKQRLSQVEAIEREEVRRARERARCGGTRHQGQCPG